MLEVKEILYRYQRGVKKRALSRSLGIARNTLREIIKMAEKFGFKRSSSEQDLEEISSKILEPRYQQVIKIGSSHHKLSIYHKQIEQWRESPYMTTIQILRLLTKQGVKTSETSLRRYIKASFKTSLDSTMRIPTVAGEQAQVDFGYIGKLYDKASGKLRKGYAFVMTLSHSRYRFVRFVFKQDSANWIDCHIRAFEFFGGVPATIVLDNLKAGITEVDFYDPIINRSYGELERCYGFVADPAKVRTPKHKGKVERSISIIKQQLIAGCNYPDISSVNERALEWCRYEISERICRTTGKTPWQIFVNEEKQALLPLPIKRYEQPTWHIVKVHRDQHLVIEGSFYSLPYAHLGQQVVVRCSENIVQVFYQEKLIKTHNRAKSKGSWITDQQDYPKGVQIFLSADKQSCLDKAGLIGKATYAFCEKVLVKPTIIGKRKVQAILRFANKYPSERLEAACKRALEYDNLTYKCIDRILKNNLEEKKDKINLVSKISLSNAYLRNPKEFSHYIDQEVRYGK